MSVKILQVGLCLSDVVRMTDVCGGVSTVTGQEGTVGLGPGNQETAWLCQPNGEFRSEDGLLKENSLRGRGQAPYYCLAQLLAWDLLRRA